MRKVATSPIEIYTINILKTCWITAWRQEIIAQDSTSYSSSIKSPHIGCSPEVTGGYDKPIEDQALCSKDESCPRMWYNLPFILQHLFIRHISQQRNYLAWVYLHAMTTMLIIQHFLSQILSYNRGNQCVEVMEPAYEWRVHIYAVELREHIPPIQMFS